MPLFGYVCESCEQEHELLLRADDQPNCPNCGSDRMVKQLSAFAPQGSRKPEVAPGTCGAQMCCGMRNGCGLN